MKSLLAVLTVTLALGVGCGNKDKKPGDGSGSGSAGSGGSGVVSPPTGPAVGPNGQTMAHRGGMCPSTVFGSTTTSALVDDKIVLTIAADNKDAIDAVQKRTDEILKEKGDGTPGTGGAHDQKGSHGGGMGMCPVHLGEGGTATSKRTDKGVEITITAKGSAQVLKDEIDIRIKQAGEWVKSNVQAGDKGQGGMGGGSGNDGMNHSGQGDGLGQQRKAGDGSGSAAPGSAAK